MVGEFIAIFIYPIGAMFGSLGLLSVAFASSLLMGHDPIYDIKNYLLGRILVAVFCFSLAFILILCSVGLIINGISYDLS